MSLTASEVASWGYDSPRQLSDGRWIALQRMLFTWGLYVIENEMFWRTRWCFERERDARAALAAWDGVGDPPGPWIVQKPEGKHNPNYEAEEAQAAP